MNSRIRVLDEQLINKIAAGEVVENSASVVKELVENSIDAGASEVGIWIKAGGRQLIRVADNGMGMGRDDALLCLERHATSKIQAAEDLVEIVTLGFRGEAVPAIASVSKLTLLTAPLSGGGTKLTVEGGKIYSCLDASRSLGTTFEVEALFYNTPARRAFQKSISHDANEVERLVQTMALAYPAIRFDLTQDEKLLFSYRSEELGERIKKIFGDHLFHSFKQVAFREGDVAIWGYLSDPTCTKPTRSGQYIFLNGRAIDSKAISEMVRVAYGTRLPERRHPLFVLHFQLPGKWIDVNVHPQKRQVRVCNEQELQAWVDAAVAAAWPPPPRQRMEVLRVCEPQVAYIPSPVCFEDPVSDPSPPLIEMPLQVVGLYGRYLLVDSQNLEKGKKGLAFVDVLAARRRILYEELMVTESKKEVQMLLIPLTMDLLPSEKRALHEREGELERLGFEIRFCGPQSVILDAFPVHLEVEVTEDLLRALLTTKEELAVVAAMRGVSIGPIQSIEEGQRLLKRLLKCAIPFFDPKGKSLVAYLEPAELFS